jgi:hypothetical protein
MRRFPGIQRDANTRLAFDSKAAMIVKKHPTTA